MICSASLQTLWFVPIMFNNCIKASVLCKWISLDLIYMKIWILTQVLELKYRFCPAPGSDALCHPTLLPGNNWSADWAKPWSCCIPSCSEWHILLSIETSAWHPDDLYISMLSHRIRIDKDLILLSGFITRFVKMNAVEEYMEGRNIEKLPLWSPIHLQLRCERADFKFSDLWTHNVNGTSYSIRVKSSYQSSTLTALRLFHLWM